MVPNLFVIGNQRSHRGLASQDQTWIIDDGITVIHRSPEYPISGALDIEIDGRWGYGIFVDGERTALPDYIKLQRRKYVEQAGGVGCGGGNRVVAAVKWTPGRAEHRAGYVQHRAFASDCFEVCNCVVKLGGASVDGNGGWSRE